MRKHILLLLIFLTSCGYILGQQKKFEGDLKIFSNDDFADFVQEGYTHINGDFVILKRTRGLSDTQQMLEEHPDGLNTLIEVTGDIRIDFEFFQPPGIEFKRLKKLGGTLNIKGAGDFTRLNRLEEITGSMEIVSGKDISMKRLQTIGGELNLISFINMEALYLPRLREVNNLFIKNPPAQLKFNALTRVNRSIEIEGFNSEAGTELISMPQLVSVGENVLIGGSTDNSGNFKALDMPRLKSVGGELFLRLSWAFFEKQTLNSLEKAEKITIEGGGYLSAPRLNEVAGDFVHIIRTNFDNQEMELTYPQLTAIRGKLSYSAAGVNDERVTLRKIDLPKLTFIRDLDIQPSTYFMENLNLPELVQAESIKTKTSQADFSQLQGINQLIINSEPDFTLLLPELTRIDQLQITTTTNEPIKRIDAAKLETIGQISIHAKNLSYPKLKRIVAGPGQSLEFLTDVESADFNSLESLDNISFRKGSFENMNFSALKTVEDFSISEVSKLNITLGELTAGSLALRDIESSGSLSLEAPFISVRLLEIARTIQTKLELPVTRATTVSITNAELGPDILKQLTQAGVLSCSTSNFGGQLNLSQLISANSISTKFQEPTALNLSGLTALGSFGEDTNRLTFENVTDLDLSSLLQVSNLSPNPNTSQETSVLKSVSLGKLKTVGSLNLISDALETVVLSDLSLAEQINIKSEKLSSIDLTALAKVKTLNISGSQIGTIGLSVLKQIQQLDVDKLVVTSLDLSSLTQAGDLTFTNLPEISSMNLRGLAEMGLLTLTNLPRLETVSTLKPGEENGLKASLSASGLFERTVDITCQNGQKIERTFFPALRVVTLGCESYEIEEDKLSTRPVVEEDFNLIGSGGTAYQFDETISFPSLLVSNSSLSFGQLAETTTDKMLSIEFTNTGQEEITATLSLENDLEEAFNHSITSFTLTTGEKRTLNVSFTPTIVGSHAATLVIQTDSRLEIPLSGAKDGCVKIGGICITADNIQRDGEGIFILNGNILMNDFLRFSGELSADTNENSLSGNGEISVIIPFGSNIPFPGENILYTGEFGFSLSDEANKTFSSSLQSGANSFFRLANLPVAMEDLQFIENGIQFSASMTLPPQLKNTEVHLDLISLTTTKGLELTGEIDVPGNIKLGGVSELRDLNFTFDTAENEFSGSATLGTKLFDMEGTVTMRKGGIDEVEVTIIPAKPIPVGPTGWSITEGTGKIISIQSPPITLGLSVDMEPTVTAGFDLVKLNDLGLEYTFGKRLKGSGTLAVFNQPIASASLEVRARSITLEGNVNFGDFLIGDAVLAVTNTNAGIKLRGALSAKLQIPEGDSFFYQVFDSVIGLPYVIASTEARLNNTVFTGETTLLGHSVAYGVAYVDEDFTFELAASHELLNQEVFGSTGGGTANFTNTLTNRFEGRSLVFKKEKPVTPSNSTNISESAEETEKTFTLSHPLNDIFIRVQHETIMPQFVIIKPDGTEVNADNAEALGALAVSSETTTKQAFYAFKQPEQGEWKIVIKSEDAEYAIDIAGADPEPSITFGENTGDGEIINQSWSLNNVNEDYKVHLLYDDNNKDFNGIEIATDLSIGTTDQDWDISDIETGVYYLYAELENTKTGVTKAFYSDQSIRIVQAGAPAAPSGLRATNNDTDILVDWEAVPDAVEYTLYYAVDEAPDFNSSSVQTDQLFLNLNQLTPGKKYFFAVSAWTDDDIEGELSEAISLNYTSESINNTPTFEPVATTTILAGIGYEQTLEATDLENDPLTFSLTQAPEGMSLTDKTINWTPTIDQFGPHSITAEVEDDQGSFSVIIFTLLVEQPNDPPTDINLSNTLISENNESDAIVGSLSTIDPDITDEHSYELITGEGDTDNSKFSITGTQLVARETFDFESTPVARVRIKSTDKVGQSLEKAFELTIENINEAPTALTISNLSITENMAANTPIGTLSTEDPDMDDNFTYTLVSGDGDTNNTSFDISGNSLLSAEIFDFETKDSYSIRLATTDAGGLTIERSLTVTVLDGPDPIIRIAQSSLTFEPVALGLSQTLSFTIHNDGDGPLDITGIQNPEGFTTTPSSLTVDAGGSADIQVIFSPTEERLYQGDIQIVSNAGSAVISASGEGAIITNIDDPALNADHISLYPNPARDLLIIDLKHLNSNPTTIQIYDQNGRGQFSTRTIQQDQVTIDVSQWKKGIYLLRLATMDGAIIKKIMKQ